MTVNFHEQLVDMLLRSQLSIHFYQRRALCPNGSYRNCAQYLKKFSDVQKKCNVSMLLQYGYES